MIPELATNVWFEKYAYEEAENRYYLYLQKKNYGIDIQATPVPQNRPSLSSQIAATRQQIKDTLQSVSNDEDIGAGSAATLPPAAVVSTSQVGRHAPGCPAASAPIPTQGGISQEPLPTNAKKKRKRNRNRSRRKRSKSARCASSCCQSVSPGRASLASVNLSLPPVAILAGGDMGNNQEVTELKKTVDYLVEALKKVELRMTELESKCSCGAAGKVGAKATTTGAKAPPKAAPATADDDLDLFGSDEDEEADAVRQERLKAYAEKKAKKPAVIAKSSIVLDVKPWDDETDMNQMEKVVRSIVMDGLMWGTSKFVPLAFGIKKLQIVCVVEDDKVSIDELNEKIEAFEDYVQSVDIAAFNKI